VMFNVKIINNHIDNENNNTQYHKSTKALQLYLHV